MKRTCKSRRARPKKPGDVTLVVHYAGVPNRKIDRALERVVGKKMAGSGFSFMGGTRDVDWILPENSAREAASRLRTFPERIVIFLG